MKTATRLALLATIITHQSHTAVAVHLPPGQNPGFQLGQPIVLVNEKRCIAIDPSYMAATTDPYTFIADIRRGLHALDACGVKEQELCNYLVQRSSEQANADDLAAAVAYGLEKTADALRRAGANDDHATLVAERPNVDAYLANLWKTEKPAFIHFLRTLIANEVTSRYHKTLSEIMRAEMLSIEINQEKKVIALPEDFEEAIVLLAQAGAKPSVWPRNWQEFKHLGRFLFRFLPEMPPETMQTTIKAITSVELSTYICLLETTMHTSQTHDRSIAHMIKDLGIDETLGRRAYAEAMRGYEEIIDTIRAATPDGIWNAGHKECAAIIVNIDLTNPNWLATAISWLGDWWDRKRHPAAE